MKKKCTNPCCQYGDALGDDVEPADGATIPAPMRADAYNQRDGGLCLNCIDDMDRGSDLASELD